MNIFAIIGIAFGLAMDAFAVAIAVGSRMNRLTVRPLFRLSFHFGLFQFMMPIIGWLIGSQIARLVHNFDHWVAFGLLSIIGSKMIYESFTKHERKASFNDPTRKWSLLMLSIATSIDALAVGLGIAFLDVKIILASLIIGVVAAIMTMIGMVFGRILGTRFGRIMEIVGGSILIVIGINIVVGHLIR
ncbi:MAG: manganese efflux pump MntP family protein [candidate division Zixibacteria bacterium]|nr:manganese efflux pump MntP family protein [candidate division Zixibacteria bacterium]